MRGWITALLCAGALASQTAHAIVGCWISEAGTSVIEIIAIDGVASGRVVGLEEPHFVEGEAQGTPGEVRTDLNNPDAALRAQPVAGITIVSDLVRGQARKDGEWVDGRIYDPEAGRSYAATGTLNRDGSLGLRGYIGSPMFGRTTKWTPAAARPEDAQRMLARTAPLLPDGVPETDCALR